MEQEEKILFASVFIAKKKNMWQLFFSGNMQEEYLCTDWA